jgi:dolichol-phosphate mannosyltransferase
MVRLAMDAVSSFSSAPLRLAFHAGLLAIGMCVALMGYALYNKIYEAQDLSQWASTFLVMLFLGGIQMMMLGVLGVYIGRIFDEVKGRPVFLAEEKLGISRPLRRPRTSSAAIARAGG